LSIRIYYGNTKFRLSGWRKTKKIVEEVIRKKFKFPGELNVIIVDDIRIREINNQFLKHDYNTDVIAFNYNERNIVNGEIYISIETVRRNAREYNVNLGEELFRVLIHGVLHLLGFNDKTETDSKKMRESEDYWIGKMKNMYGL
jgi:rRNA maturation RNase YbeY